MSATLAGSGDYSYRLRNVRHYAHSARHPGFTAGLEGGAGDGAGALVSPSLEYQGSWGAGALGSFDVYGAAFYTVFSEKPYSHQVDLAENIAWRLVPYEKSRLVIRLDNEDLAVFFPDKVTFAYAVLEPGLAYSRAFAFGDLSLSAGFPVLFKPESGLNSWLALAFEHPVGLSVSICPRMALVPDARYNGTTLALGFAWDRFFAKAAFVTNSDLTALGVSSYAEFTLGHVVLRAGADFAGLGTETVSASPFAGAGYHF